MQNKINEKLREYRKKNNMTQQQVADYLDVSRQAVTKWESGESLPSTANLIALADLYRISVEELTNNKPCDETNQEEPPPRRKPFWTMEKHALFVVIVGILSIIIYFVATRAFSSTVSMSLYVVIDVCIFCFATFITYLSDARSKSKRGFIVIFLPVLILILIQIAVGLICEL